MQDDIGNALVTTFGVNTRVANATTFTVQSLSYNGGVPVTPAFNNLACVWKRDRTGKITMLTQNGVLVGEESMDVVAQYEASKNRTQIWIFRQGVPLQVITRPGLVSLYLTTNQGVVGLQY